MTPRPSPRSRFGVRAQAWARSVRVPSQLTILLPLAVGLLLTRPIDPVTAGLVLLFGLFDHLFIVWANDYADREQDGHNPHPTPFGGGSRVLVDGLLPPRALKHAALVAAVGTLATAGVLVVRGGAPALIALAAVALLLMWAYSFPPLRLSYRGGGELLQMLGVGGVLPVFGYAASAGHLDGFPWLLLILFLPLELGCALATTRPDEVADRRAHKNTLASVAGGPTAGTVMFGAHLVAIGWTLQWLGHTPGGWGVIAAPLLFNLGAIATVDAKPGTRGMVLHTLLALLVTVTLLAGLVVYLWPC